MPEVDVALAREEDAQRRLREAENAYSSYVIWALAEYQYQLAYGSSPSEQVTSILTFLGMY